MSLKTDLIKLKEFAERYKSQDTLGTMMPVYWAIMERKRIHAHFHDHDGWTVMCGDKEYCDGTDDYNIWEFITKLYEDKNVHITYKDMVASDHSLSPALDDAEFKSICQNVNYSIDDIIDILRDQFDHKEFYIKYWYDEADMAAIEFTEADAKQYIEKHKHNYRYGAYCCCRCIEKESTAGMLMSIISTADFDELTKLVKD